MKRFFEIFRAGNYPQGNITDEQVQQIAENYDPSFLEAPITFDHGWGGPAYGWIQELKAEGGRLLATFKDVTDSLKMFTATKQYKRHSVEIYNDLDGKGPYLKALSMLGASTPAVKGMEPIEFAAFSEKFPEDETAVVEFDGPVTPAGQTISELCERLMVVMDYSSEDLVELLDCDEQVVDDMLIGSYDIEAYEEVATEFSNLLDTAIDATEKGLSAERVKEILDPLFEAAEETEDEPATFTQEEVNEKISAFQQKLDALQDQLNSQQETAQQFKDENEQIKFEARKAEFTGFLESHIKETGKFPPKLKDTAIALFGHLDGMSDGNDTKDASPLQLFKDLIEGLPVVELDEHARKPKVPKQFSNANELADAAREYMESQRKLGKHISAAAAVTHVKKHQHTDE